LTLALRKALNRSGDLRASRLEYVLATAHLSWSKRCVCRCSALRATEPARCQHLIVSGSGAAPTM
jgi:hypothetical protein